MAGVRRGDLVEFTDTDYCDYPPVDTSVIRFGVAVEDEPITGHARRLYPVPVKLADGSVVKARYVHSYGWAGWVPDGLELILSELEPGSDGWDDCDIYPGEE